MRTRLLALLLTITAACACSKKPATNGPGSDVTASGAEASGGGGAAANPTEGSSAGSSGSRGSSGSSGSSAGSSAGSAAAPTDTTGGGEPGGGGPSFGEKCGPADICATGLKCVSYYGIAGPRGPQFKSCEKTCAADTDCPTGKKCTTIADGPGQVCR